MDKHGGILSVPFKRRKPICKVSTSTNPTARRSAKGKRHKDCDHSTLKEAAGRRDTVFRAIKHYAWYCDSEHIITFLPKLQGSIRVAAKFNVSWEFGVIMISQGRSTNAKKCETQVRGVSEAVHLRAWDSAGHRCTFSQISPPNWSACERKNESTLTLLKNINICCLFNGMSFQGSLTYLNFRKKQITIWI